MWVVKCYGMEAMPDLDYRVSYIHRWRFYTLEDAVRHVVREGATHKHSTITLQYKP